MSSYLERLSRQPQKPTPEEIQKQIENGLKIAVTITVNLL